MSLFTAGWAPIGKVYYRKLELYSMQWVDRVNLADFMVAAAVFGGPIAIYRDPRKIQKAISSAKPCISIYSSSGLEISSIKWNSGRLMYIAWSITEDLMCVNDEGDVISYDMHGVFQATTSMGEDVKVTKVLDCKVFNSPKNCTGVAVLTGAYNFYVIENVKEPRTSKLPAVPGLTAPPSSWAIVTEGRTTKVLVAKDAQLYVLGQNKCVPVTLEFINPINAIIEISVSCNHKHVALFCDTGALWMGSASLEKKYSEFYNDSKMRPEQLAWCGNSAVAGIWKDILLIIGMENEFQNYEYKTPICIVSEIDGLRIISNAKHELLQKVPDTVADVFRIGSLSPSALLLEASKEYQNKNHKADEYIRMIRGKNQLEGAITNCLRAASHEFVPSVQKMLVKAAYFGKCFFPDMDSELYVKMCKTLRVLNAVRVSIIGLPLTHTQLEYLTLDVLLDRLVLRHHYPLAIMICQYLGIPDTRGTSRIYSRWACCKVNQNVIDPDRTAQEIAMKLGYTPGISYSEISNKAMNSGHKQLAVKLLDYESRASEQVPLLIKLNQEDQAMFKAIESGDTDLVFTVILHLKEKLQKGKFHLKIRQFPEAYSLYLKFCKDEAFQLLRESYDQESDYSGNADTRVLESYRSPHLEQRVTCLLAAADLYKNVKSFSAQVTEEQVKLLRYQTKLEDKMQQQYLNLSLQETMRKILTQREFEWADILRKEFNVPDRRFWWLKTHVLADGGDWLELEKFSKSKKSPIGYEPFVDVCLKFGNKFEAKRYLTKVKDENKVKYYIKAGMLEEAANVAFEQKNLKALNDIHRQLGLMDRTLSEKIMMMKTQLGSKR